MTKHPLAALYLATEGEGIRLGTPQVFVRYQGCAVGCLNCDSKETWAFTEGELSLTTDDLVSKILSFGVSCASITGGDPVHPKLAPLALELTLALKAKGLYVNLEAAGVRIDDALFEAVDFISFDYKTPSTGVHFPKDNIRHLSDRYTKKAQIKCVIADEADFFAAKDLYNQSSKKLPWVLTPSFIPGESLPLDRFLSIIELNEKHGAPFRVILQQHKLLHGPNKKNI